MPDRCLLVIDMQNDFVGPVAVMRCEGGPEIIPGAELAEPLRRRPDDFLVIKRRFSSFLGTDLDMPLHGLGVKLAWADRARAAGASIVTDTRVTGFRMDGERIRRARRAFPRPARVAGAPARAAGCA
ncbi:MAG: cysteine hydrolase family protein [Bacillota bacterium]